MGVGLDGVAEEDEGMREELERRIAEMEARITSRIEATKADLQKEHAEDMVALRTDVKEIFTLIRQSAESIGRLDGRLQEIARRAG